VKRAASAQAVQYAGSAFQDRCYGVHVRHRFDCAVCLSANWSSRAEVCWTHNESLACRHPHEDHHGREEEDRREDVYKIRSTAKTKGVSAPSGKRGRAAKAPAAKASAASAAAKGGEVSKRDFVLSFGPEVKASEILRQAKEAGIGLSKAYLYTIRSSGGASVRRGASAPASKGQASAFARVKSGVTALEAQFIDAAIDMGLSKAGDLLERLRSRLKTGL
jgi:hypothetical protein